MESKICNGLHFRAWKSEKWYQNLPFQPQGRFWCMALSKIWKLHSLWGREQKIKNLIGLRIKFWMDLEFATDTELWSNLSKFGFRNLIFGWHPKFALEACRTLEIQRAIKFLVPLPLTYKLFGGEGGSSRIRPNFGIWNLKSGIWNLTKEHRLWAR